MTSTESFKNMYKEFLNELMNEFPTNDKIKDEKFAFIKFKGDHMKRFMKRLRIPDDYGHMIQARDAELFNTRCKLVLDIGLDDVWKQANDETKDTIWQYLGTMYMLTTTVSAIPPKMLRNIETMANQIAKDVQTNGNEIDFSKLMKSVEGMMKGANPNVPKGNK